MSWKKEDQANSIPITVCSRFGLENSRPNADSLYQNEVVGDIVPGSAIGIFLYSPLEAASRPGVSSPGWNLRIAGSGGRAGRVSYETLYAMSFDELGDVFGLTILNSLGGTVNVPLTILDSNDDGFEVTETVLDSQGNPFVV